MRSTDFWNDYELIDCSDGERLERWGDVILIRPDPQVIWKTQRKNELWKKANARYHRSAKGGGEWEILRPFPDEWNIGYRDLTFKIKPMGFKHTGLFPEQAVNWDFLRDVIRNSQGSGCGEGGRIKVLNLFAYTGGATISALAEDAAVVHVDASKGMVAHAKENAALSGLSERFCRWLVDDCEKFIQREIRRGNRYDIIIMDPPSYGRGPGGEVWQLEDKVYEFVELASQILSDDPKMVLINSYTAGLSPSVMSYILGSTVSKKYGGKVECDEIGLPVTETGMCLPCGASAIWTKEQD
ncbi:MAG: class I SAM-dependent methyltransferase [Clostridiales bacterium]|nr:class I SAM-dependent methyltransferase [Clostridiales bacterium]